MVKFFLFLSTLSFSYSSSKFQSKTREIVYLAQTHILQGNYEAAIESYQTAYKMTASKNLLFDIALATTLVRNKKESINQWKIFLQESKSDKKRSNLWQNIAQTIVNILLSTVSETSLNSHKNLLIQYIKRIYMGKGYLVCKQLIEFALYNADLPLEEQWFLNKIYADCFYQQGGYEYARKLYRNLFVVLKNQELLLDEARCFFRLQLFRKGLKSVLSISDKTVKRKIGYHTILISLYAKMGRIRHAKKFYLRAKKYFTNPEHKKKLLLVAKNFDLDT